MNQLDFAYDKAYEPPAPVIQVVVRTPYAASSPLPAFIDSGADSTIVPLSVLQQIGARYIDKRNLIGITGLGQTVGLYPILIQIGEEIIYGIEAADHGDEIVLGRDVLNQITVILDGPLLTCELRI